jgi:hypothetical protein
MVAAARRAERPADCRHEATEVPLEESLFAYTLSQADDGWIWRLWDESGEVVAKGDAPDQVAAMRRLAEAYEKTRTSSGAYREDPPHERSLDPCGRFEARGRMARRGRNSGQAEPWRLTTGSRPGAGP